MKRQRELTEAQEKEAIRMAPFFPKIAPGHGSQHKFEVEETVVDNGGATIRRTIEVRCSAKDCHPIDSPRHKQDTMSAAARFILERDRGL